MGSIRCRDNPADSEPGMPGRVSAATLSAAGVRGAGPSPGSGASWILAGVAAPEARAPRWATFCARF